MLMWTFAAVIALTAQVAPASPACARADVGPAVSAAVERMAGVATAAVQVLSCNVEPAAQIDGAIPEPAARYGRPVRFRLMAQGRQAGYAVALASGPVRQVRVNRAVEAGAVLDAADLTTVVSDASGALIEPLPAAADLVGRHAVRSLAGGEVLTARIVRIPAAVQSGDRVVVRARVGTIHVTAVGIAQQTGRIGDVIRLVNHDSRRPLRGRIIGRGEVEVVHGS
jgi:flagella basal body P-ring formation protein FlgA